MSKTVITFAVLDAALGALVSGAKGTGLEGGVADFKAKFEEFRSQPVVPAYKDLSADLEQAKGVITGLKQQLADALDVKASKSDRAIVAVGNVKYVVHHGAYPHSIQDIVDNPELAKDILKIAGQKALVKL